MKKHIILSLIVLGLNTQCKNENAKKSTTKIEQICAVNNYNFYGKTSLKFQFFSDSTYVFTITKKEPDYEKFEKFTGHCFVKNDTVYFKPLEFKFDRRSEKAVIKNNFIEFINDKSALKIEITKNLFHTKNKLDLKKYSDYAFFSFNQEVHSPIYYNYDPNTIKPYDLQQSELIETDQILKKCFKENNTKLKNINHYIKQCIVVINKKQEKEVWISCYCNDFSTKDTFKYDLIDMSDGGNCNINLKINLTNRSYSDLHIAGRA
ncbi:hypothetical protein [Flavobacterium johnsoniae]|uniref:hypothetical protein n=1 Tax=Flavobacterium johnsoniae TaxID=986 RepID=UPI003D983C13